VTVTVPVDVEARARRPGAVRKRSQALAG
jgi:hypothetical protein